MNSDLNINQVIEFWLKIIIIIKDSHLFLDICINKIRIFVRISIFHLFPKQSIEIPKIRIEFKLREFILHSREYSSH